MVRTKMGTFRNFPKEGKLKFLILTKPKEVKKNWETEKPWGNSIQRRSNEQRQGAKKKKTMVLKYYEWVQRCYKH
jgi:hypothetical protein